MPYLRNYTSDQGACNQHLQQISGLGDDKYLLRVYKDIQIRALRTQNVLNIF